MKHLFLILLLLPVSLLAQNDSAAKSNLALSIVLKNNLPIHHFKNIYSYGIGGAVNAELKISNSFAAILTPGFFKYFFNRTMTGLSGSTGYLLFKGGAKYYPSKNIYVNGEAGVGIKSSKFGKESAFAYSAAVGFFLSKNINVELEYSKGNGSTFTPENIGLNVGYTFFRDHKK